MLLKNESLRGILIDTDSSNYSSMSPANELKYKNYFHKVNFWVIESVQNKTSPTIFLQRLEIKTELNKVYQFSIGFYLGVIKKHS